jgi:hypothetical protein
MNSSIPTSRYRPTRSWKASLESKGVSGMSGHANKERVILPGSRSTCVQYSWSNALRWPVVSRACWTDMSGSAREFQDSAYLAAIFSDFDPSAASVSGGRGGPGSAPCCISLENPKTHQRGDLLASSTRSATRMISITLSVYPSKFRAPTSIQRKIVSAV